MLGLGCPILFLEGHYPAEFNSNTTARNWVGHPCIGSCSEETMLHKHLMQRSSILLLETQCPAEFNLSNTHEPANQVLQDLLKITGMYADAG